VRFNSFIVENINHAVPTNNSRHVYNYPAAYKQEGEVQNGAHNVLLHFHTALSQQAPITLKDGLNPNG